MKLSALGIFHGFGCKAGEGKLTYIFFFFWGGGTVRASEAGLSSISYVDSADWLCVGVGVACGVYVSFTIKWREDKGP